MGEDTSENELNARRAATKAKHVYPGFTYHGESELTFYGKFINSALRLIDTPATWFRESIVLPAQKNRPKYYHRRYKRVPTVDECYENDVACIYEADVQYKRDREVERYIVRILGKRLDECMIWYADDKRKNCADIEKKYRDAELNWYIKYGTLQHPTGAKECYMKQKHRLIWERRHGPIGTGRSDTIRIDDDE